MQYSFFILFSKITFDSWLIIDYDVTIAGGILFFLRLALGGAAGGALIAIFLNIALYYLERRLEQECKEACHTHLFLLSF